MIIRTINVISEGFAGRGTTKSVRKKHLKEVLNLSHQASKHKPKGQNFPKVTFWASDLSKIVAKHDDLMVILAVMMNAEVKIVFIDQGSSADIIFKVAFNKLGLKNFELQSYPEELIGFLGEKVHPDGFITLHLMLSTKTLTRTIKVDFLVVDYPLAYNVIIGRPTWNKVDVVISTSLLMMKFITDEGRVGMVKAD